MRKEYEQAYMSEELKTRIVNTCERLEYITGEDMAGKHQRKMRVALVAMAAVMVMTFSVYAASEWYYDIFSRLFGAGADLAADTYSHPEVEVLTNTFEGLDIQVKGIAATNSQLYVLIDITATDGTVFDTSEAGRGRIMRTGQGNEVYISNPPRYSNHFFRFDTEDDARFEYNNIDGWKSYSSSASVLDIPDGDERDNHMSIAWVEKTTLFDYPGSVVVLSINEISRDDSIIKEGTWKVKFTVPDNQYKSVEMEVNKKTGLLRNEVFDYSSPDEYVYDEIEIKNVRLDPLCIEYTYAAADESFLATHTFHEWIEMKDGSVVGYPDVTEASHHGDMFMRSGKQGGSQGMITKTFDKPIDINNVRSIHIGRELTIYVD